MPALFVKLLKQHFNTAKQIIDKAVLTNSEFKNKFPRKKKLHKNTDELCNGIIRTYKMMFSVVYTSSYKDEIEQSKHMESPVIYNTRLS